MENANIFVEFKERQNKLINLVPKLYNAVKPTGNINKQQEWQEFVNRPDEVLIDGKPILVATLFGPTGAGKSAIFNFLTGLNVPSGDIKRPTSYNCAAAIPEEVKDKIEIEKIFPQWNIRLLSDPEELKDESLETKTLFYTFYNSKASCNEIGLILADVPDFNSVEKANWEKANQMCARSEVVLFIVYPEGYKDERTIKSLKQCCTYSGELAIIFNKTPKNIANSYKNDLIKWTKSQPSFQTLRNDGKTLADFFEKSSIYYCDRKKNNDKLNFDDIQPLCHTTRPFKSILSGHDAEKILLSKLNEVTKNGIKFIYDILDDAKELKNECEGNINKAEDCIHKISQMIAGSQFPVGRMLELVIETANETRPKSMQKITRPFSFIAKGVIKPIKYLIDHIRKNKGEIRGHTDYEREKLDNAVEDLYNKFRELFPKETIEKNGSLNEENFCKARENFKLEPIPIISQDWENFVKEKVRMWAKNNKSLAMRMGSFNDLALLVGGSIIVFDLFFTGGLGSAAFSGIAGPIGLIGAASAGAMTPLMVIKLAEEIKMKHEFKSADEEWRKQRAKDLFSHLSTCFAEPLILKNLERKANSIKSDHLNECRNACDDLKKIMKQSGGKYGLHIYNA